MIKNLLFDLGGVIMDIRRANCVKAFEQIGMADADSLLGEYSQAGVFAGIENGSLTPQQFHDEIRRIIGRPITDVDIDTAFQKFLIGIPPHRLEELRQLHEHYKMYMLSNTNPIMWDGEISRNFRQAGKNVDFYFDGIARSYEVGAMKPDPRIFRWVIERFCIRPEETVFFDDSQTNVEAARALGFRAILVTPGSEFIDLLKKSGYTAK